MSGQRVEPVEVEVAKRDPRFVWTKVRSGAERIAEERERQMALGWSREHDNEHADGDLYEAAIAYLLAIGEDGSQPPPDVWPWEPESWKPSDEPMRNLEKAGALIAAEIDRLAAVERHSPSFGVTPGTPTTQRR